MITKSKLIQLVIFVGTKVDIDARGNRRGGNVYVGTANELRNERTLPQQEYGHHSLM